MSPIICTPRVGDKLIYKNAKTRMIVPVRVVKVYAAVCEVEILAGGLNDSCKGGIIRAHMCLLFNK